MVFYFGAHLNSDKLIWSAKEIKKHNGNLLQIFIRPKTTTEEYTKFKTHIDANNIKVVVHSSYMNNLATPWTKYSYHIKSIENEIKIAHMLGAIGIVIHFGKRKELTIQEAYNNMFSALVHINKITKQYDSVKILLETSTGQGTEICYKLEDLSYFYKKITRSENKQLKNRIKLCIDTCHVFSAGYNLKTKMNVKLFLETFEELIGLQHVKLIHLNDCKVELGSQVDRHQTIGNGYIGYNGLKYFFNYFKNLDIPIILETPEDGYKTEISKLLN